MDLLKILRSFEEFIFEATSWLIFYPMTLWRVVRDPLAAMEYSDREQGDPEERRYDDALSPPLFLLATLVLVNLVALAAHVPPPPEASEAMKAVAASPQNLILFRSLAFSLIPLVAAASLLHRQGRRISRETLRAPFYAQCYLAALCAASVSIGTVVFQRPELPNAVGAAIIAGGFLWFQAVQTAWFRRRLAVGWVKAALLGLWATVRALAYLLALLIPIAML
ncbi:hypothetical protein MU852_05735 [Brevundimonas albigilva]|uniref:Permease n=1 Tax=Brevundimonas albigilva TaxID=1312364 RepID=A0ABY4SNF6_9CAUL|nr:MULTISPECIES: hypothetical protein [Brevundimonas]UQV19301.1 hypothetical protein MU852_05735 [Brevundimonas albigilva]URI15778.1 hypothetical protein M8231_01935 [Brevundimonas albigilva]